MPFLTDEEIAQRQAAGVTMKRLNCGWNISHESLAQILTRLEAWEPQTDTERRDKRVLELAFIHNMNASQIARLKDPLLVGMGNRSKGKPLSVSSILTICHKYAPGIEKRQQRKCTTAEKRNTLFAERQKGIDNRQKVCATCGTATDIELHHIIPLAAGGTNDYFNLIYLCHACHMELHHRIYDKLE